MLFRAALLAAALMATASCSHPSEAPASPAVTPTMLEVEVPNIPNFDSARPVCTAAAEARSANWSGLYWTRAPGGSSVCVVSAGTPGSVDPIIFSSHCDRSSEAPFECLAIQPSASDNEGIPWVHPGERIWSNAMETPVALRDGPDATSRAIGQIAPGSDLVILDLQAITYFSHRGVFRAPYSREQIEAGQVVVPTFGTTGTPWINGPRYDSALMGSDTMTYPQRHQIAQPGDAPRLDIAWEELPHPSKLRQMWALVRLPDGSTGWADFEALAIDLGLEDE